MEAQEAYDRNLVQDANAGTIYLNSTTLLDLAGRAFAEIDGLRQSVSDLKQNWEEAEQQRRKAEESAYAWRETANAQCRVAEKLRQENETLKKALEAPRT